MEKAGRKVDETIDKLQHGDEGTLEKAGRKIGEAAEEAEKKLKKSDQALDRDRHRAARPGHAGRPSGKLAHESAP